LGTFTITDNINGLLYSLDMTTTGSLDVSTTGGLLAAGLRILVTPSASGPLTAAFSGTPLVGPLGTEVSFTDESTGPAVIDSWNWDFGLGNGSTAQNPSFTYNAPGLYDVSLTVGDNAGDFDTVTRTAYVDIYGVPTADFSTNVSSGPSPLTVNFTDLSVPGGFSALADFTGWSWDFGDGSTSTSQNPTHVYNTPGQYTVSLTVTDGYGQVVTETKTGLIAVANGTAPEWELPITVSDANGNSQILVIGYHPDGTADYDFGLDLLAPPAGPVGIFDARTRSGSRDFLIDFRGITVAETDFNVLYAAETNGSPITLSWNPGQVPSGLNYSLNIVDATGTFGPIDMSVTSSLVVTDPAIVNGLIIRVGQNLNVFARIQGPALSNVTLTRECVLVCTVQVDISQNPERLGSFTGRLDYSSRLSFLAASPILSDFTGNVVVDEINRRIDFNGARPAGRNGVVDLLILEFAITGPLNTNAFINMSFSAMAAANTFIDLLPQLSVENFDFIIQPQNILGDVNNDGLVNSTDALIVLSYDAGRDVSAFLDRINAGVGDVNGDGVTNSTDALFILSYDVGLYVPVPIGEPFCFNSL
jgi:PKD repeat protein